MFAPSLFKTIFLLVVMTGLSACTKSLQADLLLTGGAVYIGDRSKPVTADIAISDDTISFVGKAGKKVRAQRTIDVSGLIVAPGFIDPHTHSLGDLESEDAARRENNSFRLQGVTTVFVGNDGGGSPQVDQTMAELTAKGIGTNVAMFVGHGAVRRKIMGYAKREPSDEELAQMKLLVREAMQAGALGLSTGLFYAPGSFAQTDEIVALAKVAAEAGGVYDSHIRDESSYTIGLEAAIDEAIEIGRRSGIPVNISHIKALGADSWNKSGTIIEKIAAARAAGLQVTADQYPWTASSTSISSALIPSWMKEGGRAKLLHRLNDQELRTKLIADVTENLRRRGGASAILITASKSEWQGLTLEQLAQRQNISPVEMALEIIRQGGAKIASFTMIEEDIANFMQQDWVMTGSDGGSGHPRKYASFPRKFKKYVGEGKLLPVEDFLYRSSGLAARTFNLCQRGFLRRGYKADIVVFDPKAYRPRADYENPALLSEGVEFLLIGGQLSVDRGISDRPLAGKVLRPCPR